MTWRRLAPSTVTTSDQLPQRSSATTARRRTSASPASWPSEGRRWSSSWRARPSRPPPPRSGASARPVPHSRPRPAAAVVDHARAPCPHPAAMIGIADPVRADADLAAGTLRCPGCAGPPQPGVTPAPAPCATAAPPPWSCDRGGPAARPAGPRHVLLPAPGGAAAGGHHRRDRGCAAGQRRRCRVSADRRAARPTGVHVCAAGSALPAPPATPSGCASKPWAGSPGSTVTSSPN